jgi:hypothetical protein
MLTDIPESLYCCSQHMHMMQIPICIILWSFEVMTMNSIVRNVTPCGFICTNVSEKPTANKFRVKDVRHNLTSTAHPKTGHEGPEGEYRYSYTLSLTSALERGGWSMLHPCCFTPKKETWYPLYRRLGGTRVVLDGWRKSRHHRDSILRRFSQ